MQTAILTDFKIDSKPTHYNAKNGGHYYVFFASSVVPDKKGVYFKVSCQAWNHVADKMDILKLHAGSIVNIIAEMCAYEKDGRLQTSYNITDINIATFLGDPEKQEEKNRNHESKQEAKSLLQQLAEAPFN